MFVSEQGVSSCDHPLWVMEAVPREDPILALQLGGLRTHQTPLWRLNQEKGDLVRAPTVHSCEMFGGPSVCCICNSYPHSRRWLPGTPVH